jgi:two-component sensor histidine kinase
MFVQKLVWILQKKLVWIQREKIGALMPLGLRLVFLLILAAVPVFVVQISHDVAVRQGNIEEIKKRAETLAGLIAARQDRIVEGARLLLIATSYLQAIREQDAKACSQRLKEIALTAPESTALAVLSPAGERWCVSLDTSAPVNLADRDYFKETVRTGTMQASNFLVGRQTGEGSVVFTFPAKNGAGDITAVVFAAYRTSVLSRLLNSPPLPEGAFAAVVDGEGVIVAHWPEPDKWMGRKVGPAILDRLYASSAAASSQAIGGVEYAVAFSPMQPPSKFKVMVAYPLSGAIREADEALWRNVGWTTLIFGMAAIIAFLGIRYTVTLPINQLRRFADELSQGNFRTIPPLKRGEASELQELSMHIESMSRSLESRQAELMEALSQKEILLKEVNHRVKNSLQLVASLFGPQRAVIKDPDARRQFQEAGRRITTVAQIHQRLYQDSDVDRVSLDKFLGDLCADLNSVLNQDGRIRIECEASPCHLPTEQIIPLALIANELITNAFKYGYAPQSQGVIRVSCAQSAEHIKLSVADEGVALPDDFDLAKLNGLGMRMIQALAQQLRAEFKVVSGQAGKSFELTVPLMESGSAKLR